MTSSNSTSWKFADFEIINELYSSPAGRVLKARCKSSRVFYVLKETKDRADVKNELKLFETMSTHENVINYYGHFYRQKKLYLVLEYAEGGDLYNYILQNKKDGKLLSLAEKITMCMQISCGILHLHLNGIVHRDIKSLNLLLSKNKTAYSPEKKASPTKKDARDPILGKASKTKNKWVIKVGDLGVSRQVSLQTLKLQSFYGTPLYTSPEICKNEPYDEKTDIWSLGVVFYEVVSDGTLPFDGDNLMSLAVSIQSGKYKPLTSNDRLSKLVDLMLRQNPNDRPSISSVVESLSEIKISNDEAVKRLSRPIDAKSYEKPEPSEAKEHTTKCCEEDKETTTANKKPAAIEPVAIEPIAVDPVAVEPIVATERADSKMSKRDARLEQRRLERLQRQSEVKQKQINKVESVEVKAHPKVESNAPISQKKLSQFHKNEVFDRKLTPTSGFSSKKQLTPEKVKIKEKAINSNRKRYNLISGQWQDV